MTDTKIMGRVAVIGDIGGHADELRSALVGLGMEPDSCTLPEDLTVVQVGDLIHRGPASGQVLELVRHILLAQPDQWVQLAGNHEALYLPGAPQFHWSESLSDGAADLLRHWWNHGQMTVAVGLATAYGDLLVTHAGLTTGLWNRLDRPTDVRQAAPLLNALPEKHPNWLWETGRMMNGGGSNWNAGPCWAEAGHEVYASWLHAEADGISVPFGQIHGHSSAYWWDKRQWSCPRPVADRFVPMRHARHVKGVIGSRRFAGIDPTFGHSVRGPWEPLVLDRARVVAR